MVDRVMALPEGTRAYLLAPVVRARKGEYRKELAEWQKAGYTRCGSTASFIPSRTPPRSTRSSSTTSRSWSTASRSRTASRRVWPTVSNRRSSWPRAWPISTLPIRRGRLGRPRSRGRKGQEREGCGRSDNRIVFSEKFACPVSGFTLDALEPRLFSFNAPQGACPACDGLGEKLLFDPQLVVPNEHLSLKQGAVVPWAKSNPPSPYYMQVLASLAAHFGFSLETPWEQLPVEVKIVILHGTAGKAVPLTFIDGKKSYTVAKAFEGVIGNLNRRMLQTESAWMREELGKFRPRSPARPAMARASSPRR
jgi:excinuclease ABC subunit A